MKLPVPTQGIDLNPNCVFSKGETKLSMGERPEGRQQVQPSHCLLGSSKEVGVTKIFIVPGQHHQHNKVLEQQTKTLMVEFQREKLYRWHLLSVSACGRNNMSSLECPFVWALISSWGPPHVPITSQSPSSEYYHLRVEDSSTGV